MQMTERHVADVLLAADEATAEAAHERVSAERYRDGSAPHTKHMARVLEATRRAARLADVAEHLRGQGSEVERLRAAANAAFDLLGGIDDAAEARDLLLAGLMPVPPLAAEGE